MESVRSWDLTADYADGTDAEKDVLKFIAYPCYPRYPQFCFFVRSPRVSNFVEARSNTAIAAPMMSFVISS